MGKYTQVYHRKASKMQNGLSFSSALGYNFSHWLFCIGTPSVSLPCQPICVTEYNKM